MHDIRSFFVTPEMEKFANDYCPGDSDAMDTLLNDEDHFGIREILANITLAYLLKDKEEVIPEDKETVLKVQDRNAVADALAAYSSFVCAFNQHYTEADFDWLYEDAWRQYFKYLDTRLEDYAFDGTGWKKCWEGALFMD